MARPLTQKQKALLDEMSRSINPTQEARELLAYELEQKNPAAIRAFIAEIVALRQFAATARAGKRGLAPTVRTALERLPRARSYAELVELADAPLLPRGREPGMD